MRDSNRDQLVETCGCHEGWNGRARCWDNSAEGGRPDGGVREEAAGFAFANGIDSSAQHRLRARDPERRRIVVAAGRSGLDDRRCQRGSDRSERHVLTEQALTAFGCSVCARLRSRSRCCCSSGRPLRRAVGLWRGTGSGVPHGGTTVTGAGGAAVGEVPDEGSGVRETWGTSRLALDLVASGGRGVRRGAVRSCRVEWTAARRSESPVGQHGSPVRETGAVVRAGEDRLVTRFAGALRAGSGA